MHRNTIIQLLENHQPFNPAEASFLSDTISFIKSHKDCFERSLMIGHVTGSAWILDQTHRYALLTHHLKLDKWFQTGGHCDGDPDVLKVAMKEAEEETGLSDIKPVSEQVFDVDIHLIPERKGIPAHFHYDIRFLLEADKNAVLVVPEDESSELKWIKLEEVTHYNNSDSIVRMVEKSLK